MSLRPATLDCLFHELYANAVRHPAAGELWELFAAGLARVLGLPLVLFGHYEAQGIVAIVATSRESRLWLDLQRLPERWDGSVIGRGLAAMALDSEDVSTLGVDDERFLCWRDGAERDQLASGGAVAVDSTMGRYLIQCFSPAAGAFSDTGLAGHLREVRDRLQRFLADLALLREQRMLACALDGAGNPAFITDREGTIVWCNRAFTRLYGYSREEAVGQNPRFLKSGRQGVRYYRELWSTIRAGKVWAGETVDRDRNGMAYTVRQTISPFALEDEMSHFLAVHDDVSREIAQRQRQELRSGTDPVTGLLTRAAFEAQARGAEQEHWALLLVSLQEFLRGLQSLGGDLAERIEAQIGDRIQKALGGHATGGVIGTGEYAVRTVPNSADHTDEIVRALREALSQPFPQLEPTLLATPRIGLAHYPEDGADFDSLVHHADRQLANQPLGRARR